MKTTIGQALGISVMGMCVVFVVLAVLMCVILIMKLIFKKKDGAEALAPAVAAPAPAVELARGSCGEVSRFDVPDRTAAMLMAIVADELDAPLNELRFIKIREVEDDEK